MTQPSLSYSKPPSMSTIILFPKESVAFPNLLYLKSEFDFLDFTLTTKLKLKM